MAKRKRVNPRRVPLGQAARHGVFHQKEQILQEASSDNIIFAWLLVLHSMLFQEAATADEMRLAWDTVDHSETRECLSNHDIHQAEAVTGLKLPHPGLEIQAIRSEGEADAFRRKARENALYLALFSVALALRQSGRYEPAQIKRIFFNAVLTLAEIESGHTGFDQLLQEIEENAESIGRKKEK